MGSSAVHMYHVAPKLARTLFAVPLSRGYDGATADFAGSQAIARCRKRRYGYRAMLAGSATFNHGRAGGCGWMGLERPAISLPGHLQGQDDLPLGRIDVSARRALLDISDQA